MPDIPQAIAEALEKRQDKSTQIVPRASTIGRARETCLLQGVGEIAFHRWLLPWAAKQRANFDEGKQIEELGIGWLREAFGADAVSREQQPIQIYGRKSGVFEGQPVLTGQMDLALNVDGERYAVDIKSINQTGFYGIKDANSLFTSSRPWERAYPAQLQMYMLGSNIERGMLLFINKNNPGPPDGIKQIEFGLNMEYCDWILDAAEEVLTYVRAIGPVYDVDAISFDELIAKGQLPPRREYDRKICGSCRLRHLCLPAVDFGKITPAIDLQADYERMRELREPHDEYDDLEEGVKSALKVKGVGEFALGDAAVATVSEVTSTAYDVPKEIKKQYAKPNAYLKVTFRDL